MLKLKSILMSIALLFNLTAFADEAETEQEEGVVQYLIIVKNHSDNTYPSIDANDEMTLENTLEEFEESCSIVGMPTGLASLHLSTNPLWIVRSEVNFEEDDQAFQDQCKQMRLCVGDCYVENKKIGTVLLIDYFDLEQSHLKIEVPSLAIAQDMEGTIGAFCYDLSEKVGYLTGEQAIRYINSITNPKRSPNKYNPSMGTGDSQFILSMDDLLSDPELFNSVLGGDGLIL